MGIILLVASTATSINDREWRGGLYHAPVIPAGIRSFLWNLAESGGIILGREPCQNCHSRYHLFWKNRAIPELGLEWNLVECKKKKKI